ncbi:MAG: TIGR02678 family protein [Erysipelotrichaceae bacterium]|nr:TIGR02678 family protein [Erysipelotrichaceae bacterium]
MNEFHELLQHGWIIKDQNKELYNKIKKAFPSYKKFINEQLGWRLVMNEKLIKLEKTPAHAEPFMGIKEFQDINDYCYLCAVLICLEDKEDSERFLLSEMVNQIEAWLKKYMSVDWTNFNERKSLVRVLQFCENLGLLKKHEESSNDINNGLSKEVLYENTGLSRYFASGFQRDISSYQSYMDFENDLSQDIDEDRGYLRINRVYRTLVCNPMMYWEKGSSADALYLKNQRPWVQRYLNEQFGGELHIHKNCAMLMLPKEQSFKNSFPNNQMISDIVLLLCCEIRKKVEEGLLQKESDETICMPEAALRNMMQRCKEDYRSMWSKEYNTLPIEKLEDRLLAYMQTWMMIKRENDFVRLYPSVGKFSGHYSKRNKRGENDE